MILSKKGKLCGKIKFYTADFLSPKAYVAALSSNKAKPTNLHHLSPPPLHQSQRRVLVKALSCQHWKQAKKKNFSKGNKHKEHKIYMKHLNLFTNNIHYNERMLIRIGLHKKLVLTWAAAGSSHRRPGT